MKGPFEQPANERKTHTKLHGDRFFFFQTTRHMEVLSSLILSWKICTITTQSLQNLYSFCCPVSSSLLDTSLLFASTKIGFWSSQLSSFCSCVPFTVFLRSLSSQTGHLFVWVHFSLHNPRNPKSCQSQLSYHHPNEFWIQIQRWCLVSSCKFWVVFPKFLRYYHLLGMKNINNHLFPLKYSVGYELPSPDS